MAEVKLTETINVSKSKKVSFQSESPAEKIKRGIINACARDGGRYVQFEDSIGILTAAVKLEGDFYFALLDKDRKIQYFSSSERYSLIKDIPADLSILNYLWNHDRISLLQIATNEFDYQKESDEKFELLTPIYIRIPQRQSDSKKQMGRKNYKNNTKQKGKKTVMRH